MKHDILTPNEVWKMLRISDRQLFRLCNDGKIPCFRVGGQWRFERKRLESWIVNGGGSHGCDPVAEGR